MTRLDDDDQCNKMYKGERHELSCFRAAALHVWDYYLCRGHGHPRVCPLEQLGPEEKKLISQTMKSLFDVHNLKKDSRPGRRCALVRGGNAVAAVFSFKNTAAFRENVSAPLAPNAHLPAARPAPPLSSPWCARIHPPARARCLGRRKVGVLLGLRRR